MAMLECPECGKSISDQAKFCPQCGLPDPGKKTANCLECGNPIHGHPETCPECGFPDPVRTNPVAAPQNAERIPTAYSNPEPNINQKFKERAVHSEHTAPPSFPNSQQNKRKTYFNLVWATNAMVLFLMLGIIKIFTGDIDNGSGIILVFCPFWFIVAGFIGIIAAQDNEPLFGIKSRVYWIILTVMAVLSIIGQIAIFNWAAEMESYSRR